MPIKLKANKTPKIITDLRDLVKSSADLYPDNVLYYYMQNKKECRITYLEHYNNMNYLGTAFAKLGIMGKNIAVIGETHPYYMTAYYAAVNGGGVIIPLDKELADQEIINFLNLSEACAIVYTESFNNRLINYREQLPNVKFFIPIHDSSEDMSADDVIAINYLLEEGKKELEGGNTVFVDHKIDMEKMVALLFTSGTTGTSKGVMLSQHNLTAATNAACQSMEYDDRNTFVSVLPMNHSYEVTCGHFAISNLGASIFINDSLKNALRNFGYFKPNALMLVPLFVETMYKKIWLEIDKKGMRKKVRTAMALSDALLKIGIDLRGKLFAQITGALGGNLRSIVCGGAPLNPQLIKDFNSFGIIVLEGYGITECAPLVAVNSPGKIKYRSVGQPVWGCQVKIDHPAEDGTGEILVKGENVMLGYYKNEEATKEVFTEDGWFRTGDIGYIDDKNYIFITGRKKNVIILSNGKNVFPEEIEEYLGRCDMIAESVVIGRNNANNEPVITAIVYPNYDMFKDVSKDEIYETIKAEVNKINKNLPSFKQIREIELRDTEFEKTTSRKIKRFTVK